MAEKQKTQSTRGIPRSAGKKGKKRGGFYYKLVMEEAKERKQDRLKKREKNLDKRRLARAIAKDPELAVLLKKK
jgi:hypothetical protein